MSATICWLFFTNAAGFLSLFVGNHALEQQWPINRVIDSTIGTTVVLQLYLGTGKSQIALAAAKLVTNNHLHLKRILYNYLFLWQYYVGLCVTFYCLHFLSCLLESTVETFWYSCVAVKLRDLHTTLD